MKELENAIAAGSAEEAARLAAELAKRHARVTIAASSLTHASERPISVIVQIEDRRTSGVSVTCPVLSSTTILQMKQLMFNRFEFPIEVQRWIIGHRLVPDHHTLAMHNVRTDGAVIYLYLVAMRCVAPAGARKATPPAVVSRGPATIDDDVVPESLMLQSTDEEANNFNLTVAVATPNISELSLNSDLDMGRLSVSTNSLNVMTVQQSSGASSFTNIISSPEISISVQPRRSDDTESVGWTCPSCTFINRPLRPGCALCATARPDAYVIPEDYQPTTEELRLCVDDEIEKRLLAERQLSYNHLLEVTQQHIVQNQEGFNCQICLNFIEPGEGIVLRECLHNFCRPCLQSLIYYSSTPQVVCPYSDGTYTCNGALQDNEIRELVDSDQYERYLMLSLQEAESRATNSYHCQTADCPGWCTYEDDVNLYHCEICKKDNCLTCKAIHAPRTCREYQKDLKVRSRHDIAAQKTQRKIEAMLRNKQAMHCPTCEVILIKKDGCDWVQCTMCKTDICWITRGRRWGPNGEGDTSGGCRCGVDDKLCHPRCQNCH